MKQTIRALAALEGRVYVYLATDALGRAFLQQAEAEGFTFGDGGKPSERKAARVLAVNPDHTLSYVGFAGMAAFGAAKTVGGKPLIRAAYDGTQFHIR